MRSTALTLTVAAGIGLVLGQSASAADLSRRAPVTKAPVAVGAPAVDWSGFYIGAHVGGGWSTHEGSTDLGGAGTFALASYGSSGFIGGAQIGFNVQNGPVVWGIELDGDWTDFKGVAPCVIILTCSNTTEFLGTLTARLGFTADKALIYVKGGGAIARFEYDTTLFGSPSIATADEDKWGWTLGTGVEYAFAPNWSAKIEYNYYDFRKDGASFEDIDGDPIEGIDTKQSVHTVKFGINYRFAPWGFPVSAKY